MICKGARAYLVANIGLRMQRVAMSIAPIVSAQFNATYLALRSRRCASRMVESYARPLTEFIQPSTKYGER